MTYEQAIRWMMGATTITELCIRYCEVSEWVPLCSEEQDNLDEAFLMLAGEPQYTAHIK